MQHTTFEFEKARDFGAVIGDALSFFARNFKSFLLAFLTYVGPFVLIGAMGMVYLGQELNAMIAGDLSEFGFPVSVFAMTPALIIASMMVFAFVCAAVRKYQEHPDEPIARDLWTYTKRNIAPAFVAGLVSIGLLVIPMGLLMLAAYLAMHAMGIVLAGFILMPVMVYLFVPLSIFVVLHILEQNPVGLSLRRAFALVKDKWWITFAIYLVISLLASVASYLVMIPAYIVFFVKTLGSAMQGDALSAPFGMWFGIMYACGILGSLFASIYQVLGIILQYFSLREQKEGPGLQRRIESLGTTDQDFV